MYRLSNFTSKALSSFFNSKPLTSTMRLVKRISFAVFVEDVFVEDVFE